MGTRQETLFGRGLTIVEGVPVMNRDGTVSRKYFGFCFAE